MTYFIAFLEGIITFISPCLLPMIPIYISYFAGGESSKRRSLAGALGFVTGFTAVFVLMGALAGTLGSFLVKYRTVLDIVTGAVVVFFGLSYLGLFDLSFMRGFGGGNIGKKKGFISSLLFGVIFSVGWTPCVGAFLGSALMLASSEGQALKGIIMLLAYSLGLGIPFVASALLIDSLKNAFDFIKRNYKIINIVCGSLLILVGILMMTGVLGRFLTLLA
ncbi:MAG: sulfite exporter TauE/SafE family protein [Clostridia bacterium]|nr:sulfite exporter TauE/SafE family protein [Clostridia bacterium]